MDSTKERKQESGNLPDIETVNRLRCLASLPDLPGEVLVLPGGIGRDFADFADP